VPVADGDTEVIFHPLAKYLTIRFVDLVGKVVVRGRALVTDLVDSFEETH
jgi:hypothetical protein